jgi:apolipoprotein N-acyltransferase
MEKFKPYVFLLLAGALFALGYPSRISQSLLITPMIGVGILFTFLFNKNSLKKKLLGLMTFNLSYNLLGFYWIAETLVEFGELPYALALSLSALFTVIITPQYTVAVFLLHLLQSIIQKKNVVLSEKFLGLASFCFAMTLTLLEYFTPQQFNLYLGQPLIILHQYLGFAHIAGLPIYSFFSYLFVFESISFISTRNFSKINYGSIIIFIILNPFFLPQINNKDLKENHIRLVQANISNFLKIDSEKGTYASVGQVINKYLKLSLKASPFKQKLDLIIWPETAYPFAIKVDTESIDKTSMPTVIQDISFAQNSELFIGGYDTIRSPDNTTYYKTESNTGFHISDSGKLIQTYNKRVLIPFGETLPFGPFNKFLSSYIENISFFREGSNFSFFELENQTSFISTICYELLKPEFVREYLNALKQRPHFMINLTNDSWYGKTTEPEQHLFLAKWRAIEFNLPIIRSTNTGISSVIFADGSESRRLGVYKEGNLDLKLVFGRNDKTLYERFGILVLIPLFFLYLTFHFLGIKLKNE